MTPRVLPGVGHDNSDEAGTPFLPFRYSPQCLHFFATTNICSPHIGQGLVLIFEDASGRSGGGSGAVISRSTSDSSGIGT